MVGTASSRAPICHYILVAEQKFRFFHVDIAKKRRLNNNVGVNLQASVRMEGT
jgi:hypothetical protein